MAGTGRSGPGGPRPRCSFAVRVLAGVYEALVLFGTVWICVPDPEQAPPLRGTGPLHPERLRPDLPLSPVERSLERRLGRLGRAH